jgi:hypothetical protein
VVVRLHEQSLKVSDVGFDGNRKTRQRRLRFDVRLGDAEALHRLTAGLYDLSSVERAIVGRAV